MAAARGLELDRLKAITDGVFAVVLTILVLGLDVPDQAELDAGGAWGFLQAMEGQLRPYVASFASVAAFWMTHVVILHYTEYSDRTFMWMNLLFLLFVSLNPFLTEMRAVHVGNASLAFVYSGVQILCFLMLWTIWHYAVHHLRDTPPAGNVVRSLDLRIVAAVVCYMVGAALVSTDERWATLFLVAVPFLFLVHRKIDDSWR